ncbi:MAG: hypothetical protein JWP16_681 [Alphaproteobacteria bacterium]|nr:hypothetical protein [Alphaproteobacteria bacterium]
MFAFDPSQKHMGPMPVTSPAATATQSADAGTAGGEDFFHRLLDVVNPLQHLPVVGTLYRAATGEHIGPLEKIAGDALYGGLWGAATSIADVAFEQVTGKSVEDTMLAWLKPGGDTAIASTKVKAQQIAANTALPSAQMPSLPNPSIDMASALPDSRELAALTSALSIKGVDGDTASRALYAYRRATAPVVARLN